MTEDDFSDAFGQLDDVIDNKLEPAVDELINWNSMNEGLHGVGDLLEGIGSAIPATIDGVEGCVSHLGEDIQEVFIDSFGQVVDLPSGLIGEGMEMVVETTMALTDPFMDVAADLHTAAGETIHDAVDAINAIGNGDSAEAAERILDIAHRGFEMPADLATALAEVVIGVPLEIAEGLGSMAVEIFEFSAEDTKQGDEQ